MRLILIFALLATAIQAWTVEDTEIFQLQSLLKTHSPQSDSFYDLLSIPTTSSIKSISKRFKQLTLLHHPDKIGAENKTNNEYYEFLQLASSVLRDGEKRKVYDYYLKKGFPKYTGNKWAFYKFKPGTVFALAAVMLIVGVFHYIILWISYKANVSKIERLISEIKSKDPNPMDFKEKRVIHPVLNKEFMIRIDGIFMVEKTGNWDNFKENFTKIDPMEIDVPNWRDSLFITIPLYLWNNSIGKIDALKIVLTKPPRVEQNKETTNNEPKKKTKKIAKRLPNGKIIYKNKAE